MGKFHKLLIMAMLALCGCGLLPDFARAQCILANPSFEIEGSGGPVFGGWNQFGIIGSVDETVHGHQANR